MMSSPSCDEHRKCCVPKKIPYFRTNYKKNPSLHFTSSAQRRQCSLSTSSLHPWKTLHTSVFNYKISYFIEFFTRSSRYVKAPVAIAVQDIDVKAEFLKQVS